MKIIQSLKLKSGLADNCGWLSPEFNWMSCALSCLQLNKLHKEVELYTDRIGYNVLIETLKLPFSKVHVVLDDIKSAHPQLWAYSKLLVYNMQKTPFLHVDCDVFLWEELSNNLLQSPLIVQNLEVDSEGYYSDIVNQVNQNNFWQPGCILQQQKESEKIFAYNCGIIGGSDINFFKDYSETVFQFIEKNRLKIKQLQNIEKLNVFFEQYLLHCFAKENKIQPKCYYNESVGPLNYKDHFFVNFLDVPYKTKFIHTIGVTYKINLDTCLMLAKRLRQDYPEYYQRILEACNNAGVQTLIRLPNCENKNPKQINFFRTKINIAGFGEAKIKTVVDSDLPFIINKIEPKEKRSQLLKLYKYENELTNFDTKWDFERLSKEQKVQNNLIQAIFFNDTTLKKCPFYIM